MVPSSGIAISSAPMSKAEIPWKPAAPPAAPVAGGGLLGLGDYGSSDEASDGGAE